MSKKTDGQIARFVQRLDSCLHAGEVELNIQISLSVDGNTIIFEDHGLGKKFEAVIKKG